MTLRRRIADLCINGCQMRKLHGGRVQKFARAVLDEIDLQYLRDQQHCPEFCDRVDMFGWIQKSYIADGPVDYLEFGVYEGDSMRQWLHLNRHEGSRFVGFDSFEGLPEYWRPGQGRGHFSLKGEAPHIDDSRVDFIKGWFEDTIPRFVRGFTVRSRLVLHIDADLYGSAMLPLVYFSPLMTSGTLLIFDEFYDRDHEFKALTDWQKICKTNVRVIAQVQNYSKICAELE